MAKIPKFSEISANMPEMFNKVKSFIDSTLKGPGSATETEEALAKETDLTKIKLLEVELALNKLNDLYILQGTLLREANNKYQDLIRYLEQQKQQAEIKETKQEATTDSEDDNDKLS